MHFALDRVLEKDSELIEELKLCQLRKIKCKDFDWYILVPRINGIKEITDLTQEQYNQLNTEILDVSKMVQAKHHPDKLNIATIGNVVSQLHVHIVARFRSDSLFPKPIWGNVKL